jgi:hypothetical protein
MKSKHHHCLTDTNMLSPYGVIHAAAPMAPVPYSITVRYSTAPVPYSTVPVEGHGPPRGSSQRRTNPPINDASLTGRKCRGQ